ncbi:hypothetical protein KY284_004991 [Solanum tuberosum]|nr:hypothetical protein KY284_004991 [Solanum tuberosum]
MKGQWGHGTVGRSAAAPGPTRVATAGKAAAAAGKVATSGGSLERRREEKREREGRK